MYLIDEDVKRRASSTKDRRDPYPILVGDRVPGHVVGLRKMRAGPPAETRQRAILGASCLREPRHHSDRGRLTQPIFLDTATGGYEPRPLVDCAQQDALFRECSLFRPNFSLMSLYET